MATITFGAGAGAWQTDASWVGGVKPSAADDVLLTSASGNCTIDSGAVCRSLNCTGYTGVLTHNAITLNIGDATAGLSNVAVLLVAGMTYTLVNATTSALLLKSTSATQQTITSGGKTLGNVVINGAGSSYQLQDAYTSSGSFTNTAGTTFDTNSQTMTLGGAGITFAGRAFTYGTVTLTGSGAATITGANTFAALTRTGTAVKTDSLVLAASQIITGTLTLNGNSVINRLLIVSNLLGTPFTLTAATVAVTNADFKDITGAGAGSWNLSAITGLSGDCGGNSGITFTTTATQYWVGGTGNWSDAAEWGTTSGGSGGRTPLPQDHARFDANAFSGAGQVVTIDMPRIGTDFDITGVTNTPRFINSATATMFGSLTIVSGITTSSFNNGFNWAFEGRGSRTIDMGGFQGFGGSAEYIISAFGGTYTLNSDLVGLGGIRGLLHTSGTFNSNNFNVTISTFSSTSGFTRTITMGSSTWTITGASGEIWQTIPAGLIINSNTSTILFTNTGTSSKTFRGSGFTYNNFTITGGGTGTVDITGANTFNIFTIGAPKTVRFTAATTTTLSSFIATGTAGNIITISSITAATHTLSKASGTVSADYLSLTNSIATGGAAWYAGANSTNVSGNTGWIFTAPGGGGRPERRIPRGILRGVARCLLGILPSSLVLCHAANDDHLRKADSVWGQVFRDSMELVPAPMSASLC